MPQRYYVEKSMNPHDVSVEYPVDFDGMVIVPQDMLGKVAAPAKAESFEQAYKRIMHPEQVQKARPAETVYKASPSSALLRQLQGRWG